MQVKEIIKAAAGKLDIELTDEAKALKMLEKMNNESMENSNCNR